MEFTIEESQNVYAFCKALKTLTSTSSELYLHCNSQRIFLIGLPNSSRGTTTIGFSVHFFTSYILKDRHLTTHNRHLRSPIELLNPSDLWADDAVTLQFQIKLIQGQYPSPKAVRKIEWRVAQEGTRRNQDSLITRYYMLSGRDQTYRIPYFISSRQLPDFTNERYCHRLEADSMLLSPYLKRFKTPKKAGNPQLVKLYPSEKPTVNDIIIESDVCFDDYVNLDSRDKRITTVTKVSIPGKNFIICSIESGVCLRFEMKICRDFVAFLKNISKNSLRKSRIKFMMEYGNAGITPSKHLRLCAFLNELQMHATCYLRASVERRSQVTNISGTLPLSLPPRRTNAIQTPPATPNNKRDPWRSTLSSQQNEVIEAAPSYHLPMIPTPNIISPNIDITEAGPSNRSVIPNTNPRSRPTQSCVQDMDIDRGLLINYYDSGLPEVPIKRKRLRPPNYEKDPMLEELNDSMLFNN